jgi:hypothetical protein
MLEGTACWFRVGIMVWMRIKSIGPKKSNLNKGNPIGNKMTISHS